VTELKKTDMLQKSNALNQAGYKFELVEHRLIELAIVWARETETGITADTHLVISAAQYAKLYDVTLEAAYQALSDAAKTLFERQVTFWDIDAATKKPWKRTTRWVSEVSYVEGAGQVKMIFAPAIVPEITRLERAYTEYQLEDTAGFASMYAVRLYQLVIQWLSTGKTPVFELEKFREQLGLCVNEYPQMCDFKKRVVDHAVGKINKNTNSKITVSYEQVKAGVRVTGFVFTVKAKPKAVEQAKPAKPKPAKGSNPLSGVKDWEAFYQKHKLDTAESMHEFSIRIRKEAADGTFSLSPTD
jgi:plasmid replication initiation protein